MKLTIHGSQSIFGDIEIEERNRLGRGGAATVYRVQIAGTSWAAKVFDQERALGTQKILAMMANTPARSQLDLGGQSYPQLAWPQALLKDVNGTDVGYLMPLVDPRFSFSLDHFYDQVLFDKLGSKEEAALSFRVEICLNLSALVADLHAQGHYLIDCKPQNIRVFRRSHIVSLIDCDGFSIFTEAGRYPAELVSTDYISPEAFRQHLSPAVLGEAQDRYALAVILFQLLNRGTHPFQGVVSDTNVIANTNDEKAAAGLYPHGFALNPRIAPRRQSLHHLWDRTTRELFDRAFLNMDDADRPSAADWADHFKLILDNKLLVRCERAPDNLEHIRFKGEGCPACYLDSLPKPASKTKAAPQKPKPTTQTPPPTKHAKPAPAQQKPPSSSGLMMFFAVVVLSVASYWYLNKPKETYLVDDSASTVDPTFATGTDFIKDASNNLTGDLYESEPATTSETDAQSYSGMAPETLLNLEIVKEAFLKVMGAEVYQQLQAQMAGGSAIVVSEDGIAFSGACNKSGCMSGASGFAFDVNKNLAYAAGTTLDNSNTVFKLFGGEWHLLPAALRDWLGAVSSDALSVQPSTLTGSIPVIAYRFINENGAAQDGDVSAKFLNIQSSLNSFVRAKGLQQQGYIMVQFNNSSAAELGFPIEDGAAQTWIGQRVNSIPYKSTSEPAMFEIPTGSIVVARFADKEGFGTAFQRLTQYLQFHDQEAKIAWAEQGAAVALFTEKKISP